MATTAAPFAAAIVGTGPAGFYTAKYLLKRFPNARVNLCVCLL
jgi:cation diffusion facilitator CzcD-associated flavoprotein CzcO